ncbi:pleckstrin homology domain-containing family A member 7 isoform X4 [Phyllopteryx taeniolatus]|uniref:pleckstrin homology domain-containing family A member 7 isoform X4 n=1 Tax=Phyllopteryx taeniolatus TaxID=161469 RepID=UPI002AD4BCB7|nr:pleckstrin homology domain-containing family A member 7 isoform X4 [Phyllopteryx taeniolatus]
MWNQSGYCNHIPRPGYPFYHAPCSHNQRSTTFRHPVTGQVSPESVDFTLQEQLPGPRVMPQPGIEQLSSTTVSEVSTLTTTSTVDAASTSKGSRAGGSRVHSFGKRDQAIKRNPNVPVVVRGWLYKQDSSGMRLWKRKWFVLADFCLFYYKDSREEAVLGSIPLPSYVISPVGPEDHINRKYAFKAGHTGTCSSVYKRSSVIGSQAEHTGMRTYYFSADTQEDMNTWLRAMNQAANLSGPVDTGIRASDQSDHFPMMRHQTVTHTNHINHKAPEPQRPTVHEVLLEPIHLNQGDRCSFHKDSPVAVEMDTHASLPANPTAAALPPPGQASSSAPVSRVPSRAPSRSASTLPSGVGARNGLVETPSPILEPNGIAAGTYQRAPEAPQEMRRRSTLEQVEQWVKVQKAEHQGPPSRENTLPRRTPPSQPKFGTLDSRQTLPKTPRHSPPLARHSEYKYAQDRLSHFRLTPELGGPSSNTVLQLYEWQQRQQYRHGSPTAPLYTPAPDYPFGARPPAAKHSGPPRCVSVPPSPADIPPPGPPPGTSRTLSPARRPHTPADRVTVRPIVDASVVDTPFAISPRRTKSQVFKPSTIERCSLPPSNYIMHTVSAPSLHGKTPDELTLLLIQLRRQQAKMAAARQHALAQLQRHGLSAAGALVAVGPPPALSQLSLLADTQVDDTYKQLKQDLEYLDLKVAGSKMLKESGMPVKVAESDVDVKLSRLCEQNKILKDLEMRISALKQDKDKLESVLDVCHQQMELFHEQPAHVHKIAYQQRLLQEDLVSIRAQISRLSTEMTHAWEEYGWLESSVEQLRAVMQARMNLSATLQQEKAELKRELWRIEDVMAGLSGSKANYKVTIDSVQNPERKLVPSVSEPSVPSSSADVQPPPRSCVPSVFSQTLPPNFVPKWGEDGAPPRPPLPHLYDYEETPPTVPPLPKEASAVIRHTSVRGLKRQSDERKRDREGGHYVFNGDCKTDLRSFLSEPELPAITHHNADTDFYPPDHKGLSGASWRTANQSDAVSSFVTLRRCPGTAVDRQERPKSALECLSSEYLGGAPPPHRGGRMSAEEQLERMKRHQRALVRERKRNLSQGERSSAPPPASVFDWREERPGAEGESDKGHKEGRGQWVTAKATLVREVDVEHLDYDLDISRELSKPKKVSIPERYVESDPEEPLSPEEEEERSLRTERIRKLLSKSNVQNLQSGPLDLSELDSVLQQQEKIMNASRALASQASKKSKLVAAKAAASQ